MTDADEKIMVYERQECIERPIRIKAYKGHISVSAESIFVCLFNWG